MEPRKKSVSFVSNAQRSSNGKNTGSDHELHKLYQMIGSQFNTPVKSIESAEKAINSFLTSYISLRDQLGCVIDENKTLKRNIDMLKNEKEGSPIEIQKRKTKRYKAKVLQLEEQIAQQKQAVEDAKNNAREQKVICETTERQKAKLESELQCLKNKLAVHLEAEQATPNFESTVQILEGMLAAQTEEIATISGQRDSLIQKLKVLDCALQKSDEQLKSLEKTEEDFNAYRIDVEKKLIEVKHEIPDLAREIDSMISDEIRDKVSASGESTPRNFIIEVINSFNNKLAQKEEEKNNNIQLTSAPSDKYLEILNRLEDAMRFILTYKNPDVSSGDVIKFVSDKDIKQDVIEKCAHLGKFLDENKMNLNLPDDERDSSIFDPETFKDTEGRLNAFTKFVEEHQLERPPIRELYILFCAVAEVNYVLSTRIGAMIQKVKESENLKFHNDQLRSLTREVSDLSKVNEEMSTKLKHVNKVMESYVGKDQNIGECLSDIMHIFVQTKEQNKELAKELEECNAKLEETKSTLSKQLIEINEAAESQNANAKEEIKKLEDEKHELVLEKERIEAELNDAKRVIKASKDEFAKVIKQNSRKMKSIKKSQESAQAVIADLQQQGEKMIADNKTLIESTNELRATIQKQADRMKEMHKTESKLRASREELKGRLQQQESRYCQEIASLKQQIEQIFAENATIIGDLKNEIAINQGVVDSTNETLDEVRRQKKTLVDAVTKLRISERALKMKIANIQDKYELERGASEARENSYMLSIKAQAGKQITDLSAQIAEARRIITTILSENSQIVVPEEASFPAVLAVFDEHFRLTAKDRRILSDALHLRHALKLEPDVKVSDAYGALKMELDATKEAVEQKEAQIAELGRGMQKLKKTADSLEGEAVSVIEWENWARALYYQVAEGASPNLPTKELKFLLEEVVLSNINKRTMTRKLEILRAEKQMMRRKEFIDATNSRLPKLNSIRPLLVALVFARRAQVMLGSDPECGECLKHSATAEKLLSRVV